MHWNLADSLYSKTFKKWAIDRIWKPNNCIHMMAWNNFVAPIYPRFIREEKTQFTSLIFQSAFPSNWRQKSKTSKHNSNLCLLDMESLGYVHTHKTLHSSVLEPYRSAIHHGPGTVLNTALDKPVLCSEQKPFHENCPVIIYHV